MLNLRKAHGGMQIAIIGTPPQTTEVLLKAGKLKVGWVMCHLRERRQVTRCFKYLGSGDIAVDCQDPDRSALCWKSGKDVNM